MRSQSHFREFAGTGWNEGATCSAFLRFPVALSLFERICKNLPRRKLEPDFGCSAPAPTGHCRKSFARSIFGSTLNLCDNQFTHRVTLTPHTTSICLPSQHPNRSVLQKRPPNRPPSRRGLLHPPQHQLQRDLFTEARRQRPSRACLLLAVPRI